MPKLSARSLKCTVVLSANEIAGIGDPPTPRVVLSTAGADFGTVTADIAAKAVRKAQATIAEHGSDNVACIIQGKLINGNRIAEAGLVAQQKVRKVAEEMAI